MVLFASVGGHDNDGVTEVDVPALAVLDGAFVEQVVEHILDTGMCFLHFIKQYDAIGLASYGLRQNTALTVADVSGETPTAWILCALL